HPGDGDQDAVGDEHHDRGEEAAGRDGEPGDADQQNGQGSVEGERRAHSCRSSDRDGITSISAARAMSCVTVAAASTARSQTTTSLSMLQKLAWGMRETAIRPRPRL